MRLRASEKLILLMLADIQKGLKVKGEIDPDFIKEAILTGNTWGISWNYPGVPLDEGEEEVDDKIVTEVCDILDAWGAVEHAYGRLSPSDKERVRTEAAPWGDNPRFGGFDGNTEGSHRSVLRFLVEQLERFTEFADRVKLNPHSRTLESHRRMVAKFQDIEGLGRPLTVDDLISVVKAASGM